MDIEPQKTTLYSEKIRKYNNRQYIRKLNLWLVPRHDFTLGKQLNFKSVT